MTAFLRMLARGVTRLASSLLPAELHDWGQAMRHELEAMENARDALPYALGCLGFALRAAVAAHILQPMRRPLAPGMAAFSTKGMIATMIDRLLHHDSRLIAAFCAAGATGLGLAYMAMAGAPARYLTVNLGALTLGLLVAAALAAAVDARRIAHGTVSLALAGLLLLTALFGVTVNDATRWVALGGLAVQPSLILLPLLVTSFARSRDGLSAAAIAIAALALALQPDRAMAGALAAAMGVLALIRPERTMMLVLGAALLGFMATLLRIDIQPAMPFVDRILASSFAVHPLAGLAVISGTVLLPLPALGLIRRFGREREVLAAFGALWLAIVAAALLGNYPTPLVGYGGSAILGYAIGLLTLPGRREHGATAQDVVEQDGQEDPARHRLRVRLA